MPSEIRLPFLTPETSAAEIDRRLAAAGCPSLRSADIAAAASRSSMHPVTGQDGFLVWVDAPAEGAGIIARLTQESGGYILREMTHEVDTGRDPRMVPVALCPATAAIIPPHVTSGILGSAGLLLDDVKSYLELAQAALRRKELTARKVVDATTVSIATPDGRYVDLYIAYASPYRCWWSVYIVDTPTAAPGQIVLHTRRGTKKTIHIEDGRRTRHLRAAA